MATNGVDMYDFFGIIDLESVVVTLKELLESCIRKLVSVGAT